MVVFTFNTNNLNSELFSEYHKINMFLSKFFISLALSSTVGCGLSQAVNAGSLSTTTKISTINDGYMPFNPFAFVHEYTADGNVYDYYRNTAFPVQTPNTIADGFAFKLTAKSMQDMLSAYSIGYNSNGAMLSYITNCLDYETKYTGQFVLSRQYRQDAQKYEARMVSWSFEKSKLPLAQFIRNVLNSHQNLYVNFYSQIKTVGPNVTFYDKAQLYNPETKGSLTTNYVHNIT